MTVYAFAISVIHYQCFIWKSRFENPEHVEVHQQPSIQSADDFSMAGSQSRSLHDTSKTLSISWRRLAGKNPIVVGCLGLFWSVLLESEIGMSRW